MDGELEIIIAQYNRSRDTYFCSFACRDVKMMNESGISDRWVKEHNEEGDDLIPGDIFAKLTLKERLRRWKQEYSVDKDIENIYNSVITK